MRGFGFAIGLPPEDVAHVGTGDPHPAVPATFSRGEKVRIAPASLDRCATRSGGSTNERPGADLDLASREAKPPDEGREGPERGGRGAPRPARPAGDGGLVRADRRPARAGPGARPRPDHRRGDAGLAPDEPPRPLDDPRLQPADLRGLRPPARPRGEARASVRRQARPVPPPLPRLPGRAPGDPGTVSDRIAAPRLRDRLSRLPPDEVACGRVPPGRPPEHPGARDRDGGRGRLRLRPDDPGGGPGAGEPAEGPGGGPERPAARPGHRPGREPQPARLRPRDLAQPGAPGPQGEPVRARPGPRLVDAPLAREHVHRPMAPRALGDRRPAARRDVPDAGRVPLLPRLRHRGVRRQHALLQRRLRARSRLLPLRRLRRESRRLPRRDPAQLRAGQAARPARLGARRHPRPVRPPQGRAADPARRPRLARGAPGPAVLRLPELFRRPRPLPPPRGRLPALRQGVRRRLLCRQPSRRCTS